MHSRPGSHLISVAHPEIPYMRGMTNKVFPERRSLRQALGLPSSSDNSERLFEWNGALARRTAMRGRRPP